MALTESQGTDRPVRVSFAGVAARARAWLADGSHHRIAQRVAGAAFMIRVASAALIYTSQVLLARWMGSFEFGIYVYVWTWVLLLGSMTAEERLVTFLLNLSKRHAARGYSASQFRLSMSRYEIGNYLGMRLETIGRLLKQLHDKQRNVND